MLEVVTGNRYMDAKIDTPAILCRAEELLTVVFRAPIHLEIREQFESSHTVLRCAVQSEAASAILPPTVIVKRRNFNLPTDPNNFDQSILFSNEWAALDFLSSLSGATSPGPRLYTSDRQKGLVVLEDLGSMQSVQDALYSADPQAAIDALVGIGKTLGQIQRQAIGREAEFVSYQTILEASTTLSDSSRDCRNDIAALHACMAALGIQVSERFDSAIDGLERAIHGPGALRTFVHHDAGPHNFMITVSGIKLLDYEFAGYANGFLDIVCARLAFPPAFRGRVLPPEIVRRVEEQYRLELAEQVPILNDGEGFMQAISQASAHWAFSKLLGFWDYLEERLVEGEARDTRGGRPPERAAFLRMQVFTYLRLALTSLEEQDRLPELRLALSQIVDKLMGIWPETPLLSSYPAFGGEVWHYP